MKKYISFYVRANPDSIPYKKFFREKINLKHLELVFINFIRSWKFLANNSQIYKLWIWMMMKFFWKDFKRKKVKKKILNKKKNVNKKMMKRDK